MVTPKEARKVIDQINGKEISVRMFQEEEIEKAEAIAYVLDGMTIASAFCLLDKMKEYLLGIRVNV